MNVADPILAANRKAALAVDKLTVVFGRGGAALKVPAGISPES